MILEDFNNAYDSLELQMYKVDGYSPKGDVKPSGKCPDLVRDDLMELKMDIDAKMRGFVRLVKKHLK